MLQWVAQLAKELGFEAVTGRANLKGASGREKKTDQQGA